MISFDTSLFYPGVEDTSACVDNSTALYVQFSCINTDQNLALNYNQMAKVEAIAILIAILFFLQLRNLYEGSKVMQLEWDMATITAGDYTVEMKIDQESYEAWDKQRNHSTPEAREFKQYLQ